MQRTLNELETAIGADRLFDHSGVEWSQVQRSRYLIHQHLRYDYPGPISQLRQRLVILPPERYADQMRIAFRFAVSAEKAETTYQLDEFGNNEITIFVPHVERCIDFDTWILVERMAQNQHNLLSSRWLTDPRMLEPSALTQPDETLRHVASMLMTEGKQGLALAERIMHRVHQHVQYESNVTSIHTTAAEAWRLGKGVCQDYAHCMLALCRLCQLPARYVSGHMLGEGGTHAWVEVIVPGQQADVALAVPFDPTHNRRVGLSYVTIATGRDYFDVAPTSGTYLAAYSGQLSGHKQVDLTQVEYIETTL
ncbi:MAG TPA: transglutaminase family protein [Ktedonobacteraceae bacterium]|jgi:transglutaminase-like putative cysteine protease